MQLNETHHAYVVLGFYRLLSTRGETGLAAFIKGAQRYGESRGRRMALRALRDGHPADFVSYFAYGEWESSPGAFEGEFRACEGYVDERITQCPWAQVFAAEDMKACGRVYCAQIDKAIVRGFNPALTLDIPQTQHDADSCQFYFRAPDVTPDLFELGHTRLTQPHGPLVREFAYHVADVWRSYCNVVLSVYGHAEGEVMLDEVRAYLSEKIGEQSILTIESYHDTDFIRLS